MKTRITKARRTSTYDPMDAQRSKDAGRCESSVVDCIIEGLEAEGVIV